MSLKSVLLVWVVSNEVTSWIQEVPSKHPVVAVMHIVQSRSQVTLLNVTQQTVVFWNIVIVVRVWMVCTARSAR
jgi:hypothetical protein